MCSNYSSDRDGWALGKCEEFFGCLACTVFCSDAELDAFWAWVGTHEAEVKEVRARMLPERAEWYARNGWGAPPGCDEPIRAVVWDLGPARASIEGAQC